MDILIVDDEEFILEQSKYYLKEENDDFNIKAVSSAQRGIKILKNENYDIVVSDYQMPGTNGLDFLKKVRDEEIDIPFIMFTGRGREEVAIQALNLGADRYVQKGGDPLSQYKVLASAIFKAVEHPLIFDEAQGTLDSDGVDSRRAMANSVVQMSRAAAQYRKRQHSLIIVSQSTDWIDSRMMELIDRLVLIQEKNPQKGFARAVSFDHYRKDLPSMGGTEERTPAIEDIVWEPLADDDPDYRVIETLKEQVGDVVDEESEQEPEDVVKDFSELPVDQRNRLMKEVYDEFDITQRELAALTELVPSTVNEILSDDD
ncbi:MAG: response regulator [Halodesulfurarchaeum sp.]|nr:response regulator [Halodesulfurarchaeum sp.]